MEPAGAGKASAPNNWRPSSKPLQHPVPTALTPKRTVTVSSPLKAMPDDSVHIVAGKHYVSSMENAIEQASNEALNHLIRHELYQVNEFQRNFLHLACRMNKPDKVDYLLSLGMELHKQDLRGDTALHLAAAHCPDAIDILINAGAQASANNNQEETPLHYALQHDMPDSVCTKLWRAGASSRTPDKAGQTPRAIAEVKNRLKLFSISSNAPQVTDQKNTTRRKTDTRIHEACLQGDNQLAQALISEGVDVNARNPEGSPPLHLALTYLPSDCVKQMLHKGADPNTPDNRGQTPMHAALQARSSDTFGALLRYGGSPLLRDSCGTSVIQSAAVQGRFDLLSLLLTKGYRFEDDQNILHSAWQALRNEQRCIQEEKYGHQMLLAMADDALRRKCLDDLKLVRGYLDADNLFIACQTAIEHQYWREADFLLNKLLASGIQLTRPCRKNPLPLLVRHAQTALIEKIFAINPLWLNEPVEDGASPLHVACGSCGSQANVRELLSCSPAINPVDNQGSTPLHIALSNRSLETCKLLLDAGADPSIINCHGQNVAIAALACGRLDVLDEIESRYPQLQLNPRELQTTLKRLKINPWVPNALNQTMFQSLLAAQRWELLSELIEHDPKRLGTTPCTDAEMPLQKLLQAGRSDLAEKLISLTANQPDGDGSTSGRKTACEMLLTLNNEKGLNLLQSIGLNNDREGLRLFLNELMPTSLSQRPAGARYPHITLILLNDEKTRLQNSINYLIANPWIDVVFMDKDITDDEMDVTWDPIKVTPEHPITPGSKWVLDGHGPNLMGLNGEHFAFFLNAYMDARQCSRDNEMHLTIYGCHTGQNLIGSKGNEFIIQFTKTLGSTCKRCPLITAASQLVYVFSDSETLCANTEKQSDGKRLVKFWQGSDKWLDARYTKSKKFVGITENNRRYDLVKEYEFLPGTGVKERLKYHGAEPSGGLHSIRVPGDSL